MTNETLRDEMLEIREFKSENEIGGFKILKPRPGKTENATPMFCLRRVLYFPTVCEMYHLLSTWGVKH